MEISQKASGVLKVFVIMAALVIIMAGIKSATNILVPFLLSVFIAIICNPLVKKIEQYRIPKPLAVLLVIVLFVFIALSLAGLVGNSANELSRLLPSYRAQLSEEFTWITSKLAEFNIQVSSKLVMEYFDPGAAMGMAANMLNSLGGVMANLFIILVTVIFMLFEASSVPAKLHFALDDPDMRIKQIDRFLESDRKSVV